MTLVAGRATSLRFEDGKLRVTLSDGREIAVPVDWYPRLANASDADRTQWELVAGGEGITWPTLDEDLSVEGLLLGHPAPGIKTAGSD